ncbi:MAG: restriction endonuclease subunit S, partial [Alistipes sp.]
MSRAMRDSGIPWIGEIPQEWKKHRLKSVFTSRVSGDWGYDALGNNNDKFCMRIADFDYGRLRFKVQESYTIRNYPKQNLSSLYLKKGDILIEKSGGGDKTPVGRSVIFDLDISNALYANFIVRLRVASFIEPWFIEYYLTFLYSNGITPIYIKQTTGLQNLDLVEMLENEIVYIPSLAEQKAIADFLDEKCAEIDSLVAVQEQMLEELRAYKQSLITETVTHGLNPSAPMRDSG